MTAALRIFRTDNSAGLRIGTRLDRYRLQGRLGEGGFATVYAAYDSVDNVRVALKIPDTRYINNTQSFDDLRREVEIMGSLKHDAILPLKEARSIDGHFVMVSPLGQETLGDRMMRRMSRPTATLLIFQMVEAVAFAHQNEVLHRDIKPENYIMFGSEEVRLTDFGLARIERGLYDDSASGTLGYIAPEQAMGKPSYRSDVFSLGLIIYHMLSGALPEYPFQSLPDFNKFRRGISRDFVALVRKAIDPAPSRRFRDAVAMHRALQKLGNPLSERASQKRLEQRVTRRAGLAA